MPERGTVRPASGAGLRAVRSFVLREGRLTPAQRRALERLLPRYSAPPRGPLDLERLFGRRAPHVLEIGFGDGEALAALAIRHPECDFLGVEVHRPGVGRLLQRLQAEKIGNVRILVADAAEVLKERIVPASLDRVNIFFPDPWPKKRHHKRRLIQPALIDLLARGLRPGGIVHLATDWDDYARHIRALMRERTDFEPVVGGEPGARPATKFERRGKRLGHASQDLRYRRCPDPD